MTTITPPLHSQLVKATCFLLMLLPLVDMIDEQHGRMASGGGRKGRAILLDTGQVVEQKMVGNNGTTTAGFGVGDGVIPGSTVGTFLGGGGGANGGSSSSSSGASNSWQKLFPTLTVHNGPSPSLFPSAGSSSPSASAFLSQSTYPYSGETTRGGGGSYSSSSGSLISFLPTINSKRHRHAPPPPPTSLLMTTVVSATAAVASLSSSPHSSSVATMQQQSFHFNNDNDERVNNNNNNDNNNIIINRAKERKISSHHQKKSPLLAVDPPVSLAVSSSSSSSSSRNSGPYFESNKTTIHVSAREGQTVMLDCAVALLQGRTVSWLRRRKDSLQLLTVGNTTYQKDSRLGLKFRYPNNWRLGIDSVSKADEGEYQCQLSTHPVLKTLIYHLKVIAPAVIILDENGQTKTERHYKVDSSLHLTCKASHVDKGTENKVTWLKGGRALPLSDKRIKVRFEKNPLNGDVSAYLSVSSVHKGDSGNYTCSSSQATSTIVVHVLNGELPAAVQHESCANNRLPLSSGLLLTLASALTMMMMPTTSCASILLFLSEQFTSSSSGR